MHAVDTNVVVRYLTLDNAQQSPLARRFVDDNPVLVLSTVLAECEWVMRSIHKLPRTRIAALLRSFAGLPTASLEQPVVAAHALEWFEQGMDFADALHLAAAMQVGCEALATFDRKLAASARKAGAGVIKSL